MASALEKLVYGNSGISFELIGIDMDLVLCHTTADFDTLGAAVGITRLHPGTRIVLTGGCHPAVRKFLALRRDQYALIERRAVKVESIRSLTLVDAHERDRVGSAAAWIDLAMANQMPITVIDHHLEGESEPPAWETSDWQPTTVQIEAVGATTTLVIEALRAKGVTLTVAEATVMALGIHADTGSLTFEQATPRDAIALAWLMQQGIDQTSLAEFVEADLPPQVKRLLPTVLAQLQLEDWHRGQLGWVRLETKHFIPGLSSLAHQLMSLLSLDVLFLGATYPTKQGRSRMTLIGRSRGSPPDYPDFSQLFTPLGGGGHPQAAAAVVKTGDLTAIFTTVLAQIRQQVPVAPLAHDLMSSPVRTIRPATTIAEAQRVLLRYGHAGLCVVDDGDQLVGIICRRDIELALHHGFSQAPVKGYMNAHVQTITPETPLGELHRLLVTYDIGRLPVLDQGQLVGIVTRTDLLRQIYPGNLQPEHEAAVPVIAWVPTAKMLYQRLQATLPADLWRYLMQLAATATDRGWHLYLVGGAVRDLLRAEHASPLTLQDIDLVVDGCDGYGERLRHCARPDLPEAMVPEGAGVILAQVIQAQDPTVDLQVHGQFQTATLIWHDYLAQGPLVIDIATARTEFYPYPAANPEVEASSIRQDLYRRDFTINAMAIRLSQPQAGLLLDFFGGWADLQQQQVRVLHANSFIEDPTRIFRAVRFAVRLGFHLEPQTEQFIRYAVESGVYDQERHQSQPVPALQARLTAELRHILETETWAQALGLLDHLGALRCIHPDLKMTPGLWRQLGRIPRWLKRLQLTSTLEPWLMMLEVLLAQLPGEVRSQTANHLHLPLKTVQRLAQLSELEHHLQQQLVPPLQPSEIYQCLHAYDWPTLLLVSTRYPRTLGSPIWRYLTHLVQVKPPLTGDDLSRLGYRPGPSFREILAALTMATLNGEIQTQAAAKAYLFDHFPLHSP